MEIVDNMLKRIDQVKDCVNIDSLHGTCKILSKERHTWYHCTAIESLAEGLIAPCPGYVKKPRKLP